MKMLVPAMRLHPHSYSTRSTGALYLTRVDNQRRSSHPQSTAIVCCSAVTTSSSSSDEPGSTRLAMSKADLESCQWLRPSEKTFVSESSAYRNTFPTLSASYDCCFSEVGASPNGSVQSSSGTFAQPSSSKSSDGSSHPIPQKHSRGLLNAFSPSRLLDAFFPPSWTERAENGIEKVIFDFRFLSLLAVAGSLAGSFLCFLKVFSDLLPLKLRLKICHSLKGSFPGVC